MSQQKSPWRRCGRGALAVLTGFGLVLAPTIAHAAPPAPDTTWEASLTSLESGVKSGYQLAAANGSVYVADAQWRVDGKTVGTPENTPMASGNSMRSTFSPYGVAVDPDVNGEAVIVTTTARQRDSAAGYGGGVVIYNASQGAPTDADRVFEFEDGSPVLAGPRRVAVDTERNIAYVTNLGQARSSKGPGFVLVLDLTKRGADAVIARVGLPGDADNEAAGWWSNPVGSDVSTEGVVGVAVDEANNRVYLGTMTGEKLFVLDGSQIDGTKDPKNTQAYAGAVTELDATVGANARPTFNADTKKVYVSAYDASKITVVDADPASDTYGETEHVIDVTTGSSSGNKGTNAVEVDAERGLLYSANLDAGVTVYDIENDYAPIEFTAEDGSTYTDIVTGDRVVNFGLNEDTGEVWVSTHAAAGKVHVIDVAEEVVEPEVPTATFATLQDANATFTYPTEWVAGEPLTITGAGWLTTSGTAGSKIAVKLDGGNTEPKVALSEEVDGVWGVIDAENDGSFEYTLSPFPTSDYADLGSPWDVGSQHTLALLTGTLGAGDPATTSIARGGIAGVHPVGNPSPKITIVDASAHEPEVEWTSSVSSYDTGVKSGYQLAIDNANDKVYVADAQWTVGSTIGTGKVVQFNAETKALEANHDFTGLRRNDGIVQGVTRTEPTGKVVVFDQSTKEQTGTHSFLELSRVDGTGKESEPLPWSTSDTAATKNSMRSTFSPYGIAVDPDVDGEAVVVTTTARQRSAAGYGGGVVIYKASQGAPTDADRVFEFEDGSPVLAGPRRVAIDTSRDLAYVTNLGQARSSKGPGFVLVLDLTKRGADAVVARVGLPDEADNEAEGWWTNPVGADVSTEGVVGIAVDEANNRIYLGTMNGEKLFVLDGSKITGSEDPKDTQAYADAVTELDASVGANARPTYNAATKKVYVSAYDASKITVVDADPASDTYGETEHVIDVTTGSSSGNKGTNAVEVDAERGLLYSANLDAGVTVYDIENDYAPIEFTAEDGSTYTDIVTGDRVVNFGLNEDTGEVWVSTHAAAGKVHVLSVTESAAPKFTSQPSDQEADAGETATFEVVVAGSPAPTLQWQTRSGLGAAWTDIAGATGSWIEVQAVRELDGAQYRVIAVNEHGDETSQEATLSVNYAPVVTASPTTQVVQAGGTATFTASGHGKPAASVVWQSQAPGETGWSIVAGATSATLTVPDVTVEQRGTLYRAVFTNALGDAPTQAASLAVNAVKPAPLEESVWREFVPEDTEGLLELPEGELVGVQTGTTVTISNIPVADGDWVEVFGFSKAQYLGSHLVANNGQITVNVAAFAEGTHHLAVYNANNELLGYVTFVINADGSGTVIDTPPGTRVLEVTGAEGMLPLAIGAGAALLLGAAALTLAAYRRRVASE